MKVIEGLRFGNECLNKMHQVGPPGPGPGEGPVAHGGLAPHSAPKVAPAPLPLAKRCLCQMGGGEAATARGGQQGSGTGLDVTRERGDRHMPGWTPARAGEGWGSVGGLPGGGGW